MRSAYPSPSSSPDASPASRARRAVTTPALYNVHTKITLDDFQFGLSAYYNDMNLPRRVKQILKSAPPRRHPDEPDYDLYLAMCVLMFTDVDLDSFEEWLDTHPTFAEATWRQEIAQAVGAYQLQCHVPVEPVTTEATQRMKKARRHHFSWPQLQHLYYTGHSSYDDTMIDMGFSTFLPETNGTNGDDTSLLEPADAEAARQAAQKAAALQEWTRVRKANTLNKWITIKWHMACRRMYGHRPDRNWVQYLVDAGYTTGLTPSFVAWAWLIECVRLPYAILPARAAALNVQELKQLVSSCKFVVFNHIMQICHRRWQQRGKTSMPWSAFATDIRHAGSRMRLTLCHHADPVLMMHLIANVFFHKDVLDLSCTPDDGTVATVFIRLVNKIMLHAETKGTEASEVSEVTETKDAEASETSAAANVKPTASPTAHDLLSTLKAFLTSEPRGQPVSEWRQMMRIVFLLHQMTDLSTKTTLYVPDILMMFADMRNASWAYKVRLAEILPPSPVADDAEAEARRVLPPMADLAKAARILSGAAEDKPRDDQLHAPDRLRDVLVNFLGEVAAKDGSLKGLAPQQLQPAFCRYLLGVMTTAAWLKPPAAPPASLRVADVLEKHVTGLLLKAKTQAKARDHPPMGFRHAASVVHAIRRYVLSRGI